MSLSRKVTHKRNIKSQQQLPPPPDKQYPAFQKHSAQPGGVYDIFLHFSGVFQPSLHFSRHRTNHRLDETQQLYLFMY